MNTNNPIVYKRWRIWDNGETYHPKTGRFVAESYGVEMCSGTKDGIVKMVDDRCREYPPNGHGASIYSK